LTRSAIGELTNDSFQHKEMASKWAGSNVCDQLSTAKRISSWKGYQEVENISGLLDHTFSSDQAALK